MGERTDAELKDAERTDTERLNWWFNLCRTDACHAPVLRINKDGTCIIWDQYDGLSKMGEGVDGRAAIDAAMDAETRNDKPPPEIYTQVLARAIDPESTAYIASTREIWDDDDE